MKITSDYVFFYKDWLSNYQRTNIHINWKGTEYTFSSTEQGFMFIKALTFSDNETAQQILATNKPNEARLLGRKVKNYNDKEWDKVKNEYIENLKNKVKYEIKEEPEVILEELKKSDIISSSAMELFGDIVEME